MIRQELTNVFNVLSKILNKRPVKRKVDQVKKNFIQSEATLYKQPNAIPAGGFKTLLNTTTDVVPKFSGSKPLVVKNSLGLVQLNEDGSIGLKKDVGADRSDLQTITGKSSLVEDGFLDVVIGIPHPEALAAILKSTTTLNSNEVSSLVKKNTSPEVGGDESVEDFNPTIVNNLVGNIYKDFESTDKQRVDTVSKIQDNSSELLRQSRVGFNTLIENAVEISFAPAEKIIEAETNKPLPSGLVQEIVTLYADGKVEFAAKELKPFSEKTEAQLITSLNKINNKATSQVTESKSPRTLRVQRTDTFTNLWRDEQTENLNEVFAPIIGPEITSEVLNLVREVSEIIVVFMESPGASIESYHNKFIEKYSIGFNPHFYIGYDNIIYRGRPLEYEARPTQLITNNHYQRSIIIGVNIDELNPIHKFSPGQINSLVKLIKNILEAKPGLQVYSARDVGWVTTEQTDALDVAKLIKQKLNKVNLTSYDPVNNDPLTSQELAKFNSS